MSLTIAKSSTTFMRFICAIAAVLFVGLLVVSLRNVQAAEPGERLVTIHDEKKQTSIVTRADSVQAALKQAKISTGPYDNVDPTLDTELTGSSYQINVYRAQPVMVIDGLTRKTVMTAHKTPRQIAKDANLAMFDEDKAELVRSKNVVESDGAGLVMTIDRATRFTLVLYGKTIETGTQATTVGGMLKEKKITLGKDDTLSLPIQTPVSAGMRVELWRNGKQTVTLEEAIAFPVQQIQDANQPIGYKQVKTAGVAGKKMVTYEIEMRNGVEISRKEIQSVQTLAPQQQVEVVGAKATFSGDFAAALARLRSCEGGYNSWNPAGPYYGAYQFGQGTWAGVADPAKFGNASPAEQDAAAHKLYQKRGWQPWPSCSRKLGLQDIYR